MEGYDRNSERTTQHTDKEHKRVIGQKVLTKLYREEISEAIAHTNRTKKDVDGRQRKIGWVVAKLCAKLWEWEGKSELDDAWVHKANGQFSRELKITPKQLRRAKKLAVEEGLVEHKVGLRPSDRRQTSFYRMNLWRVAQMVVEQELADIKWELDNQTFKGDARRKKRERMVNRCHTLEQAKSDLSLIDMPKPPSQQGNPTVPEGQPYLDQKSPLQNKHQGTRSEDIPSSLDACAKEVTQKIFEYAQERRVRSRTAKQYDATLNAVKEVLRNDQHLTDDELASLPEIVHTDRLYRKGGIDVVVALDNHRLEQQRQEHQAEKQRERGMAGGRITPTSDGGHTERERNGTVREYDANGKLVSRTFPSGYTTYHHQREEDFE